MKKFITIAATFALALATVNATAQDRLVERHHNSAKHASKTPSSKGQKKQKKEERFNPEILKDITEKEAQENKSKKTPQEPNPRSYSAQNDDELFNEAYSAWSGNEYDKSFAGFCLLADRGYVKSYGYMGLAYEFGQGVEKNVFTATQWYSKAADAGEINWNYRIGNIYYERGQYDLALTPLITVANMPNGAGWFSAAAALMVGKIYEEGLAGEVNVDKAIEFYTIGANHELGTEGDKNACKWGLERLSR